MKLEVQPSDKLLIVKKTFKIPNFPLTFKI